MGDELLGAAEIQRAEGTNEVVAVVPFLALLGENQARLKHSSGVKPLPYAKYTDKQAAVQLYILIIWHIFYLTWSNVFLFAED